jgi:hypothetical protein
VRRAASGSSVAGEVKPALAVRVGDGYVIQRGDMIQEVPVLALSERRGSATDAALLYRETDDSIKRRLDRQMRGRRRAPCCVVAPPNRTGVAWPTCSPVTIPAAMTVASDHDPQFHRRALPA